MTREEVISLAVSYISQAQEGEIENSKCDFKAKWYDLSSSPGINHFLKDTTAIANTFGLDGLIIIGFNEKEKTFSDARFTDSKLSDITYATDMVNKKVDRLFQFDIFDFIHEDHKLSIIHIPPSIDKPHVIRLYQAWDKNGNQVKNEDFKIFVRKGTSTMPASKYDLELMYYDRKNLVPDYSILTSVNTRKLIFPDIIAKDSSTSFMASMVIENLGRRPVAINKINFILKLFEDSGEHEMLDSVTFDERGISIVSPGQIIETTDWFYASNFDRLYTHQKVERIEDYKRNIKHLKHEIKYRLSTGEHIVSTVNWL